MPTLVILATPDAALAEAWERQLPAGRLALRLGTQMFPGGGTAPGFAALVVLDAVSEAALPAPLARCPTIYVGEPRSLPFEQARMAGRAKVYLSYDESTTRLRDFLPLVEEVAEKTVPGGAARGKKSPRRGAATGLACADRRRRRTVGFSRRGDRKPRHA